MIKENGIHLYSASSYVTHTAGGGVFHCIFENAGKVALMRRLLIIGSALGNANLGSYELRQVVNPGGGVGVKPGICHEIKNSQQESPSTAKIRINNTGDATTVTPLTGTSIGSRGGAHFPGVGSTAAGMTGCSIHDVSQGSLIIRPSANLGIYGGQTGMYATFSFEWWEIAENIFDQADENEWRAWAKLR